MGWSALGVDTMKKLLCESSIRTAASHSLWEHLCLASLPGAECLSTVRPAAVCVGYLRLSAHEDALVPSQSG